MTTATVHSRFITLAGIRTHYLEAGTRGKPVVVLVHSGEFGAAAELSWEYALPELGRHFHVFAPDWLGFGETDKLYDFANARDRAMGHMQQFVQAMLEASGATEADFIGNSMGGTNLLRLASERPMRMPMRSIVSASGGGLVPLNDERRTILGYDGTPEAMRAILRLAFFDPRWANNDAYVERRQRFARMPGAWEFANAPRMPSPIRPMVETFGKPDTIPYESITIPTLIVAGAEDVLREKDYVKTFAHRIPDHELQVFEQCGHTPNLEMPERFNTLVIDFLRRVHARRQTTHAETV